VTPTITCTPSVTPSSAPYWLIRNCLDGTSYKVEIEGGSPEIGKIILATFDNDFPYGCYEVLSRDFGPIVATATNEGDYDTCELCGGDYTGTSVNKQYEYTAECCDPVSGATGGSAVVPHAVYGTNNGIAIQLNTVELGGFNGVNN